MLEKRTNYHLTISTAVRATLFQVSASNDEEALSTAARIVEQMNMPAAGVDLVRSGGASIFSLPRTRD